MRLLLATILVAAFFDANLMWTNGSAQAADVPATLSIPRVGVSQRQDLTGNLMSPGVPVVLVRADIVDARWWVQERAIVEQDGSFRVSARFGNEKTRPGVRFDVVVLVLPSAVELNQWKPGDVLEKLPSAVPRSKEMTALYEKQRSNVKIIDNVITSPRTGTSVERLYSVTGELKEYFPVVLVRSANPGSPWWQRGREVSLLNLQYFGEELIVPSGALPLSFQAVCGWMML
jgi:hypothetical protein